MNTEQIIDQTKRLHSRIQAYANDSGQGDAGQAAKAQVCEFLRQYAGPKSSFTSRAEETSGFPSYLVHTLSTILESFVEYLEAGLATGLSPERQAQIDVVSDFLAQALSMLDTKEFHPAAPAILIGASLEEFLRNWFEAEGLSIGNSKAGIDTYTKTLRKKDLLSKQDVKDITAWAGVRNHAAHGEWDEVGDRSRVRLMLESVNLFMRQKTP